MSCEFFRTPDDCIHSLIDIAINDRIARAEHIMEPAAGDGAIIRALRESGYSNKITAIELEPEFRDSLEESLRHNNRLIIESFLQDDINSESIYPQPDVIITNPPFSKAERYLEKCYEICAHGGVIALFLRMSFLTSIRRHQLLNIYHPSHVWLFSQRPQFPDMKGSDDCGYAWVIWEKSNCNAQTKLSWFPIVTKEDRRRFNGPKIVAAK